MIFVISAILPVLKLQWFTFDNSSEKTIHLLQIINGTGEPDVLVTGNASLNWQQIILYLLAITSFCVLLFLIYRIIHIYHLKKKFPVQLSAEFDFINTDISSAPFSFFKNIFWRNDISLHEETGKQILQHEIAHIKQKHSWDKLFVQLMMCFYWANPFYHFIKKELYLIHEFIADEKAIEKSDANAFAKMLLTAQFGKFNFLPAQPFFYSSIKRRLVMLTQSKNPTFNYLRRILVLPLIACVVCLFAFTVKNETTKSSTKKITAAKPFVLVVDAGHGGKDNGAVDNNLTEKDVALKIAKEIKDLSSQYGIDVVLTRSDDVYQTPQQKSDFVNTQNADAFLSVHINMNNTEYPNNSGFEVYISKKNTKFLRNNQILGSAILQSLGTDFKAEQALGQRQVGIWVLDNSNIPSALIECGYITNADDANNLKDDAKIELMAKNILQGVAMYANNKVDKSSLYQIKNENADTTSPKTTTVKKDTLGSANALYVLNGKIVPKSVVDKTAASSIESMNVLKGKDATDKYGDKGKNGVIEITLKKEIPPPPPPPSPEELKTAPMPPTRDTLTDTKPISTSAEKEPQFPGGAQGWKTYLENNLQTDVPVKNKAPKGIYTVTLSFLIDENGKVSEVKAIKDPGYGTAAEAQRIIAKGPDWIPAIQNGHKVIYREKQNISFKVRLKNYFISDRLQLNHGLQFYFISTLTIFV